MSSAGKWVLGLLLLVVGAVFVARTISSEPGSQAQVKLPAAESAAAGKESEAAKAAAAAAAKKAAAAPATDLACKKACVEVNEVANDSVTTAKLAPGSVTLSKLAFEVPNLNELVNEINARRAAEASAKAAIAEAAAATAQNDASISAAAANGLSVEAAARTAAIEKLSKEGAAADAAVLTKLNQELADRNAADDVLQGKLNTEIADRAGAIANLRTELGNPNQVGAPIIQINNNEIVGDAVTSNKVKDATITADDLANDSVVGGLGGDIKDESITHFDLGAASVGTSEVIDDSIAAVDLANNSVIGRGIAADAAFVNVKERTLRGERTNNTTAAVSAGDLALGTITGEVAPLAGAATGNIALGTIGTGNLSNGAVTFAKLDLATQDRITNLESGLAAEIVNRTNADSALQTALNNEIAARSAADTLLQTALTNETNARIAGDSALAAFDSSLSTDAPSAATVNGAKAPNPPTAGEGLVDWSRLKDVPTGFADNVDEDGATGLNTYKNELKNAGGADTTVNEGSDPVSWAKLKDVPAGFADGTDNVDNGNAADLTCTNPAGCVSSAEISGTIDATKLAGGIDGTKIADGTITAADLAGTYTDHDSSPATPDQQTVVGAVTGEKIADSTIEARDLADGAVTSLKIADGTVDTADLKAGAVRADKVTANVVFAGVSAGAPITTAAAGTGVAGDVVSTTFTPDGADHKLLLLGQVQLSCTACGPTVGNTITLKWQLFEGATALSQEYSSIIRATDPHVIATVSHVVTGPNPATARTYSLKVTSSSTPDAVTTVTPTSGTITVLDLGR